ncbi:hypothetical protein ABKN59_002180 [Abortiporus biennis]
MMPESAEPPIVRGCRGTAADLSVSCFPGVSRQAVTLMEVGGVGTNPLIGDIQSLGLAEVAPPVAPEYSTLAVVTVERRVSADPDSIVEVDDLPVQHVMNQMIRMTVRAAGNSIDMLASLNFPICLIHHKP